VQVECAFWLDATTFPRPMTGRPDLSASQGVERMLTDPEIMECIQTANGMRSELAC